MIRVALCDDDAADRVRLRSMLEACETPLDIGEYDDGEALLWDVETGGLRFDLYYLDIYLNGFSGIEAARRIRALDEEVLIVFISSSRDFYRESYDLFAFNYLLKPIDCAAFNTVLSKALGRLWQNEQQVIRFTYRANAYTIKYSEIDYISSENRLLVYHLHNGETRQSYGKLDELSAELSSDIFVRCHQSFFVNLKHVTALEAKDFRLGSTCVPISRAYYETARKLYLRYLFGVFERD